MTPNISNTNTDFSPRISLKCVRDNDEHTRPRSELNVVFMLSSRWVGVFRHMSPFIRNDFDVLESNVTRSARLRRQRETTLSRFLPDHVERWHAFVMKHQDSISDLRNPTDPTGGQTAQTEGHNKCYLRHQHHPDSQSDSHEGPSVFSTELQVNSLKHEMLE